MPSCIDLVLHDGVYQTSDPELFTDDSDHEIIIFSINPHAAPVINDIKQIYDYSSANWLKYQRNVRAKLPQVFPELDNINTSAEVDELIENLEKAMLESQSLSVPLKQPTPYGLFLPNNIKAKIVERNNLIRRLKRNRFLRQILSPDINKLTREIKTDISNLTNANFNH